MVFSFLPTFLVVKFFFSFSLPMHMVTQKLPPWLRMLQRPDFSQQVLMVQLRYNSVIDGFLFWCIEEKICIRKTLNPFFSTELIDVIKVRSRQYGGVVRALDLYSDGPSFKPSKLLLSWFILGFPVFNSWVCFVYSQLVCLWVVGIFEHSVCYSFIHSFILFIYSFINVDEKPHWERVN